MEKFQIQSLYKPSGDQPLAIEKICQGIEKDYKDHVLESPGPVKLLQLPM